MYLIEQHYFGNNPHTLLPVAGLSAMIRGADDGEHFVVRDYHEDELENVLEEFFKNLKRT